jgi:hypothetical protein
VVENLLSKYEALSSISSTAKKKKIHIYKVWDWRKECHWHLISLWGGLSTEGKPPRGGEELPFLIAVLNTTCL